MTDYVINGVKVNSDTGLSYKSNPKRPGFKAHARYEVYASAETVAQYFEIADSKYAKADLRYDHEHGHVEFVLVAEEE